jgi:dethiobiotin synthetase
MGRSIIISGTGTDIGKTAVSLAICLCAKELGLKVAYYKPIQCGLENTDAHQIRLLGSTFSDTFETYRFKTPASPHFAAEQENTSIDTEILQEQVTTLQKAHDLVIVEGAGGAAVPWNRQGYSITDFAVALQLPMLIVASPGLGTLHQSLSAHAYIQHIQADIAGFLFSQSTSENSPLATDNAQIIQSLTAWPFWGMLPFLSELANGDLFSAKDKELWIQSIMPAMKTWWKA